MSRICTICGKGRQTGHNVSHSKRHTPHTWQPNLAKMTTTAGGRRTSALVCAKCRKTLSKPATKRKRATT
ncbi:MAG: 50S ribosomal protein L28 [Patescibacteria group bacterium]